MKKEILLCGVGGQGTVLASKLLAASGLSLNIPVRSAETIGMAQRGGSVTSHVRIGEGCYSPLIADNQADLILSFEVCEAVRNLHFLKKDGTVITSSNSIKPVTSSLSGKVFDSNEMISYLEKNCRKVIVVDNTELCKEFGSDKFFNVILLGVACGAGVLGIEKEVMKDQISKNVKPAFVEKNLLAFEKGFALGQGK